MPCPPDPCARRNRAGGSGRCARPATLELMISACCRLKIYVQNYRHATRDFTVLRSGKTKSTGRSTSLLVGP
jgi:hypothetical protein